MVVQVIPDRTASLRQANFQPSTMLCTKVSRRAFAVSSGGNSNGRNCAVQSVAINKQSACTANAPLVSENAMITPASAGPANRAPLKINEVRPMALVRYSGGTVSHTSEVRAGCWITCIMPTSTAVRYTCQGCTMPL